MKAESVGKRRREVAEGRNRERHGHTSCTLGRGSIPLPVVSDSALNEARVGFLSHPKTMCRRALAAPAGRVFAFRRLARLAYGGVSLASFFLGLPWPLPVFCIRYRIPTTSVPTAVFYLRAPLSVISSRAPPPSAIKRTTNRSPHAHTHTHRREVFPFRK